MLLFSCKPFLGIVIVLILVTVKQTNALIDDILDVAHVTKEVASAVLETWNIVEQTNLADNIDLPITREKHKKVLRRLKELSRQIEQTETKYTTSATWTIESITEYIKTNTRLELRLHEINDIMNRITARSSQMRGYARHREHLDESTLLTFAQWTVSPNAHSVNHLLERLSLLYIGSIENGRGRENSVLKMVSDDLEDAREQVCATRQSAQQFLFSLYSDISLTELKGYTMMQFSWMILRIYGKGNYTKEAELMRNEFQRRAEETQKLLREVMKRADRTVWRCDPSNHVKGQTYDEITRLLQGYIENEVDLNSDQTCRENCGYYQVAKNHGCFKDLYCNRQPSCTGRLLNCQFVDSDMWICPSASNSTRRYDYIEYENGRVLGKKGSCSRGSTKVDSWWRWLFWHCSYCFCICDEQGIKSDRFFNLRESKSNIAENMIVTGLRFKKHKRIFHLQIQEGKLQIRGNIDPESLRWVALDDYQIFDRNVRSGVDYHTMAWDKRAIDLDDVTGDDPTHIVTGVRFRVVGTHLNLEIRLTEFDFESGELIDPERTSFWKSNDNTDFSEQRRTTIVLKQPDISTNSFSKSVPTSKHNQYIEFTNTDMDKDVAQNTVPFIDIQDVSSNLPVPLSGVGIYHKGREQYGGFVAPKLITYDFSPHVMSPSFSRK